MATMSDSKDNACAYFPSDGSSITSDDDIIPVEVMPDIVLPKKIISSDSQPISVIITFIESPTSFYLRIKSEDDVFNEFDGNINAYYKNDDLYPLKVRELPVGSTWAVCVGNSWFRGKIISQSPSQQCEIKDVGSKRRSPIFKVRMVDFGFIETVPLDNIRYLDELFQTESNFAVSCRLAGVFPTASNQWKVDQWSSEAIEYMREFCSDRGGVSAYFLDTKEDNVTSVILESAEGKVFNEEIVVKGLASSSVIERFREEHPDQERELVPVASTPSPVSAGEMESENKIEAADWDPMREDFVKSSQTGYLLNDCAETLLVGLANKDEENICRFFRQGKTCPRGETCLKKHVLPREDGLSVGRVDAFYTFDGEVHLPAKRSTVVAMVTNVISPKEFYIQLVSTVGDGTKSSYTELQDDLCSSYKKSHVNTSAVPAIGELMVVCSDEADPLKGYHRVRVLALRFLEDVTEVEVNYFDLGYLGWVKEYQLRSFNVQFLRPPPMAICCYLADVCPASDDLPPPDSSPPDSSEHFASRRSSHKWQSEACSFLADFVSGKLVIAHVSEKENPESLGVVLFELTDDKNWLSVNEAMVDAGLALSILS